MQAAPLPLNEQDRLKALLELEIMDTDPEKEFDDIVQLASKICETPISLITLLDEKRQWFKARLGLEVPETLRSISFCSHAILQDRLMVVENALEDTRFFDNPLVTQKPDIKFYAGMPLKGKNGLKYGTLCVIDTVPRELTDLQKEALETLSKQVIKLLEVRLAYRMLEHQTITLKHLNEQNTKMLSIIGHDLRSPLSNLEQIIDLNKYGGLSPKEAVTFIDEVGGAVGDTLTLLDNLMTWATNQANNGATLLRNINLQDVLVDKVKLFSTRAETKGNKIFVDAPDETVLLNENVFRLLVRNLLGNANKYTHSGNIHLSAKIAEGKVTVSVADSGVGMTQEQLKGLFNWEKRLGTAGTSGERGSGVGLKLCKEMLQAAGGNLTVQSTPSKGSIFTFTLPIG